MRVTIKRDNMDAFVEELSNVIKEAVTTLRATAEIPEYTLKEIKEKPDEEAGLSVTSTTEKEVSETGANIKDSYFLIPEGNFSGRFSSVKNNKTKKSVETGIISLIGDNIEITQKESLNPNLPTTAKMLFDRLKSLAFEKKSRIVEFSLDDYIELRGLKDRKESRKRFLQDLDIIMNTNITVNGNIKGVDFEYTTHLADGLLKIGKDEKTIAGLKISEEIYARILKDARLYVSKRLFQINNRLYPNVYGLTIKICSHLKLKGGIISVPKLLNHCSEIPEYETVMKKDKHIGSRIIDAFENALDNVRSLEYSPIKNWEYCKAKGENLSEEELNKRWNYKYFKTLYVRFLLSDSQIDLEKLIAKAEKARNPKKGIKK